MNAISHPSTTAVKHLISINIIVYVGICVASQYNFDKLLALYNPLDIRFKLYQSLTHMFVHSGDLICHIIFNMLSLWMFGSQMEKILGSRKFLILYLISGIIACIFQIIFNLGLIYNYTGTLDLSEIKQDNFIILTDKQRIMLQTAMYSPMIGASGAIAGIIGAFAYFFPENAIFIMPFPFPIKVYKAIIFFIIMSVVCIYFNLSPGVAHFSHIGGTLAGYSLSYYYYSQYLKNT